MADGEVVPHSLYVYAPNKGAPIFFTILFAISAVGHLWQCCRYNSWTIIGLHPLCALIFTTGYALREYGAYNYIYTTDTPQQTMTIYIMSQVFINICPPLLELANYHILGRIFYYVPHLAPIAPNKVLGIFGALMGIVEAINALGVAFTSNPKGDKQNLGSTLILVAISIQLCVITIFICVGGLFHRRCVTARAAVEKRKIPMLMITLYTSMALILIRCIYRIVEHTGNTALDTDDAEKMEQLSPLLRHEWFFYVFDAAVMLANSLLWNVLNPGRYLPRDRTVCLAEDGVSETEGGNKAGYQPTAAELGRAAMQLLTFGVWGQFFPLHEKDVQSVSS
ncbi:hypothetical protein ASPVEDRAFT_86415 [Aspergillus versicolor CBS 583.65]|uniref:RTA1 domain protein n=1 Tax=Aspergillus versicolor CBS 583.65 TaxID=1036611 RepID=A0A1L9PUA6_ASPVE|nr:uncharacterized protein ASPVEDRAFT_86415 [Aspergillus versicolor CBS 583.65]OJJ05053.1 hypothetical protein ASPVEDRAFT_86415 [Aspergillus versicolor CBS 583.65]